MEKKNGFTLVELIAVIAILGVILLLIVPNVITTFGNGRKDTFIRQVQSIWKEADKEFEIDYAKYRNSYLYCDKNQSSEDCTTLSLNKTGVSYVVKFTEDGEVMYIAVGDKDFCYLNDEPEDMEISRSSLVEGTLSCNSNSCTCGNQTSYFDTPQLVPSGPRVRPGSSVIPGH